MTRLFNKKSLKHHRSELRKNQTDAERKIWFRLRNKQILGIRFLRQFSVGPFILDFYSPQLKLAIEIDGGQHAEEQLKIKDLKRTNYLKSLGITLLRFWDNEVLTNTDSVLEKLTQFLTPPNLPFGKRGGIR